MQKKESQSPQATIRVIDGKIVLDDPIAFGVIQAVNKFNCQFTFDMNINRVCHFNKRISELNRTPEELVITVINVDDVHGSHIAEILMPGYNWQEIRDRGEIPFARGLADRKGIQDILESFDKEAANKLKMKQGVAIVVVDNGVAEIFSFTEARLAPKDFPLSVSFMDSEFQNIEAERVARNIVVIQQKMNPDQWTPFSYDNYKEHCTHKVSDDEKVVLDAFVNGGKPIWNTKAFLQPEYLKFESGLYFVTQKFLLFLNGLVIRNNKRN